MNRKEQILLELDQMKLVNDCSYNNDGLYNEMRILRARLLKELQEIEERENGSKKNR